MTLNTEDPLQTYFTSFSCLLCENSSQAQDLQTLKGLERTHMISSISSLPEDSSKSPSGDVYSVVLLSNKSCLSRRLVLSQPSRLVSSTSLPRVFHASFPCTFAWTQIEKQWSWMAQNVEKHLCIEQNTHFAAVCDCVISNLAAF